MGGKKATVSHTHVKGSACGPSVPLATSSGQIFEQRRRRLPFSLSLHQHPMIAHHDPWVVVVLQASLLSVYIYCFSFHADVVLSIRSAAKGRERAEDFLSRKRQLRSSSRSRLYRQLLYNFIDWYYLYSMIIITPKICFFLNFNHD
jgi:hypothetical protein